MKIYINGELTSVENELTAKNLIKRLGYENARIALEVNNKVVPRSSFENRLIAPNDKIEIITAVGGG